MQRAEALLRTTDPAAQPPTTPKAAVKEAKPRNIIQYKGLPLPKHYQLLLKKFTEMDWMVW